MIHPRKPEKQGRKQVNKREMIEGLTKLVRVGQFLVAGFEFLKSQKQNPPQRLKDTKECVKVNRKEKLYGV